MYKFALAFIAALKANITHFISSSKEFGKLIFISETWTTERKKHPWKRARPITPTKEGEAARQPPTLFSWVPPVALLDWACTPACCALLTRTRQGSCQLHTAFSQPGTPSPPLRLVWSKQQEANIWSTEKSHNGYNSQSTPIYNLERLCIK